MRNPCGMIFCRYDSGFMSTLTIPFVMRHHSKRVLFSRFFTVLSLSAIGFYPVSLMASQCPDMNAKYDLDISRMQTRSYSLWLIPIGKSKNIDLKKTYNNLISKKFYQTTPRYSCVIDWSKKVDYNSYDFFPGVVCIDNSSKKQFDGTDRAIHDKNGRIFYLNPDRRFTTSKDYFFCKSKSYLRFTLSKVGYFATKEEQKSGYSSTPLPYLLFKAETLSGEVKIYTVESRPEF